MKNKSLNKNEKIGFSLAEAIISMVIIAIVALAVLPVITRIKQKPKTINTRGQYACYYDENNKLTQRYIDENTGLVEENAVTECSLDFSRRPESYFIIAVGARKDGYEPQVITDYVTSVSSSLKIDLGNFSGSNNGVTTITSKTIDSEQGAIDNTGTVENTLISALGSNENQNHLVIDNIAGCKLKTAGKKCTKPSSDTPLITPIQKSCEVINYKGSDSTTIKPCALVTCDNGEIVAIKLEDLKEDTDNTEFAKYGYISGSFKYANTSKIYKTVGSVIPFNTGISLPSEYSYTFGFTFKDSSYMANNIANSSYVNSSKTIRILNLIPSQRNTELTKKLLNLYSSIDTLTNKFEDKNGFVYVLW